MTRPTATELRAMSDADFAAFVDGEPDRERLELHVPEPAEPSAAARRQGCLLAVVAVVLGAVALLGLGVAVLGVLGVGLGWWR